jgi:hypothetical protein
MSQADYELAREREHQAELDQGEDDQTLMLSFGDGEAEVYYTVAASGHPVVTSVWVYGGINAEAQCFSRWQLDAWESSIRRRIRAEQEQAELEARSE